MQREHEAKNPGPVMKYLKRGRETIVISDDEDAPGEDQADGTLCALDLWDDRIKDTPEHWDMRDALMHGKTAGYEDASTHKEQRQREESRDGSTIERCKAEAPSSQTFSSMHVSGKGTTSTMLLTEEHLPWSKLLASCNSGEP